MDHLAPRSADRIDLVSPETGGGCHAGAQTMHDAAAAAGKSETLARYAQDYPRGPHDQPQSMCPAFGSLRVGLRMRRTATILSGLNPDLSVAWKHHWTDSFQTDMSLGGMSVGLVVPEGSTKTISNPTQSVFYVGGGGKYSFSRKFSLGAELATRQELFLRGIDSVSVTIDKVLVPQARIHARFQLIEIGSVTLGMEVSGGFLWPISTSLYSIQGGVAAVEKLFVRSEGRTLNVEGAIVFSQQSQNTSISRQSSSDIGLSVGLHWRWGSNG